MRTRGSKMLDTSLGFLLEDGENGGPSPETEKDRVSLHGWQIGGGVLDVLSLRKHQSSQGSVARGSWR